jgi:hypothetical protein
LILEISKRWQQDDTSLMAAKERIRKGEDAQYLIRVTDLKSCWKTKLRVAATEWCRESGKQKGRKYSEIYYQNNGKPWFQRFKFRRKSIVSINRIRNSLYCLKERLIRFNIVNREMRECDEAKEIINHIYGSVNYSTNLEFL